MANQKGGAKLSRSGKDKAYYVRQFVKTEINKTNAKLRRIARKNSNPQVISQEKASEIKKKRDWKRAERDKLELQKQQIHEALHPLMEEAFETPIDLKEQREKLLLDWN